MKPYQRVRARGGDAWASLARSVFARALVLSSPFHATPHFRSFDFDDWYWYPAVILKSIYVLLDTLVLCIVAHAMTLFIQTTTMQHIKTPSHTTVSNAFPERGIEIVHTYTDRALWSNLMIPVLRNKQHIAWV
jgi:hypothetical protein